MMERKILDVGSTNDRNINFHFLSIQYYYSAPKANAKGPENKSAKAGKSVTKR